MEISNGLKYYIITFGCQMNKSDSERIASVLEKIGYKRALKINEADLIVVNMCSVRQSAVDRVFGVSQKLSKLKIKNRKIETILTGCILKEDKKKFAKDFDFILNIKDLPTWPIKLSHIFHDREKDRIENYFKIRPKYQNNFSAFIPISNGCNNFCSYCVVPFTRGRLVCRDYKEILKEAKNIIQKGLNPIRNTISNGAREIWLLGQNVNDYKCNVKCQSSNVKTVNFSKLLMMVNALPGEFWIRFTSPHPSNFSDELIETMAKCKKVTPYLNLPVQSGDNEILKRMNRPYTVEQYKDLVRKIREAFKKYRKGLEKEVTLSTDAIVGFPGETKKQFENTVKLFKEIKFDMAYIAKYSPRPGTIAAKLKDNVSYQEKERRYKNLTEILKKTALKKNKKYINKTVEVLIEEVKNGFLIGKTRSYKTVKIQNPSKQSLPEGKPPASYGAGRDATGKVKSKLFGKFIKVKIIDAFPWGLKGKMVCSKN